MILPKLVALSALSLGLFSTAAWADETAKESTFTVPLVRITGRPSHPTVAVAITRLVPKAPLPELRHPLVDFTGAVIDKDPF